MKVAVFTLTRDRLDYTRHCFATLHANAGCDFDHYVLDQGSSDGTQEWLYGEYRPFWLDNLGENVGLARGTNRILDVMPLNQYDAVVKIDNDCELLHPDTLRRCAAFAIAEDAICSPVVRGLRNPPSRISPRQRLHGEIFRDVVQIGGIFLAAPARFWAQFRIPTDLPKWGQDDVATCSYARHLGMPVGYLEDLEVNHYETTDGQHERYGWYFDRATSEGKPA